MKTSQWAATSAAVLALCAFVPVSALAQGNGNSSPSLTPSTIPTQPIGDLSAYPTIVQTGTKPTLTWGIVYPSTVGSVATINPPGTIRLNQNNLFVSVQPIGTGVSGCDATHGTSQHYAEARMSINGSSYVQLFYGLMSDVEPQYSLYVKKLAKDTTIDFGGRFVRNGSWTPFYTTKSANMQVVSLVNGSTIPTSFPLHTSSRLASYLKPYLDAGGKVKIGPMSILVLMEIGSTNRMQPCFDYQDVILLVTLSTRHPNNGHGNNLDGVDVSNPGQGRGGPNGQIDPSGGIDDEIR